MQNERRLVRCTIITLIARERFFSRMCLNGKFYKCLDNLSPWKTIINPNKAIYPHDHMLRQATIYPTFYFIFAFSLQAKNTDRALYGLYLWAIKPFNSEFVQAISQINRKLSDLFMPFHFDYCHETLIAFVTGEIFLTGMSLKRVIENFWKRKYI